MTSGRVNEVVTLRSGASRWSHLVKTIGSHEHLDVVPLPQPTARDAGLRVIDALLFLPGKGASDWSCARITVTGAAVLVLPRWTDVP